MNNNTVSPTSFLSEFASIRLRRLGALLREWPIELKIVSFVAADLLLLSGVVLLSYVLRISSLELPDTSALPQYMLAPLISVLFLWLAGIYSASSRGFSRTMDIRLALSQFLVAPVWVVALFILGTTGFARSVVIIYLLLAIVSMVLLRRTVGWVVSERATSPKKDRIPVLIYGAGRQGALLADSLERQGRYQPLAFVETDYTLFSRTVNGLFVNPIDKLEEVVIASKPREVMIAKSDQSRSAQRTLIKKLLELGLKVKVVPAIDEIADGRINISNIRPVRVEDLLGRDPVPPDVNLMNKSVKERVVMVTGAGGSIGAEIVRQVFAYGPTCVVLFERSEFALFEIHREMEEVAKSMKQPPRLVAVLGDILDRPKVKSVIFEERVEVIFHAAAYKHVRLVQENALAGFENNVWGTIGVAEEAIGSGVKLFVLISTDKAVRPSSVMGATKRVAEMAIQALADCPSVTTTFAIVRFGNVLGSSGSVVPLFREQIESGGPVKVTHEAATRYFMLIPEAAQLVVQASAMAQRGEVFVLDMGEPVKILHLAKTMIEIAGMTVQSEANPDGEIEIQIVGLRDGEKLHEELQIGSDISETDHPRIMRSNEFYLPWEDFRRQIDRLQQSASRGEVVGLKDQLVKLALMEAHSITPRSILSAEATAEEASAQ